MTILPSPYFNRLLLRFSTHRKHCLAILFFAFVVDNTIFTVFLLYLSLLLLPSWSSSLKEPPLSVRGRVHLILSRISHKYVPCVFCIFFGSPTSLNGLTHLNAHISYPLPPPLQRRAAFFYVYGSDWMALCRFTSPLNIYMVVVTYRRPSIE